MTNQPRSLLVLLCSGLALSLASACQSYPQVQTTVHEGPGRTVVVETIEAQATVVAIDATRRTLTLDFQWGEKETFKVHEEAVNFEQIRVGDIVHTLLIEETAVSLVSGGAPPSVGAAAAVALAPEGERPGVVMANTVVVTGTVVAIDGHAHTVTLQFVDGRTEEFNVPKHRDLSNVGLGDSVRLQLTEALAISVVRPSTGAAGS